MDGGAEGFAFGEGEGGEGEIDGGGAGFAGAGGDGAAGGGEADEGGAAVGFVGEALDPAGGLQVIEAVGHGGGAEEGGGDELIGLQAGAGGVLESVEDFELPGGDAEWGEDFGEAFFEAGGEVLEFDDHWGGICLV